MTLKSPLCYLIYASYLKPLHFIGTYKPYDAWDRVASSQAAANLLLLLLSNWYSWRKNEDDHHSRLRSYSRCRWTPVWISWGECIHLSAWQITIWFCFHRYFYKISWIYFSAQNLFGGRGNRGRRPQGDGTGGRSVVYTIVVVVDNDGSDVNEVDQGKGDDLLWIHIIVRQTTPV